MAGNIEQRRQLRQTEEEESSEQYAAMQIFSESFACAPLFIWSMLGMLMGGSLRRTLCCMDSIPDLSLSPPSSLFGLILFYFASLKTQHRGGMLRLTSRNFLTPTQHLHEKYPSQRSWYLYSHLILVPLSQAIMSLIVHPLDC